MSQRVCVPVVFVILYAAQVSLEERLLRAEHGEEHAQYVAAAPKVVPRLWGAAPGQGRQWSLSRMLVNREQYHLLVTLALVGLFYAKWHWGW